MKSLSLKIPEALAAKLGAVAKRRKTSQAILIREALEAYLANGNRARPLSCYDLAPDLAGCLDGGPGDLATNKAHLEGFGQ